MVSYPLPVDGMDWDDVRFFLALARAGSVRGAGATLGVSHSTVGRRVEAFEERLRARLFDRSRDGYRLTDAGRRMLASAEEVETRLARMQRDLLGADDRFAGPVHLTCWDPYVVELLMPELRAFTDEHPEVDLQLSAESRARNLSLREADVALRALAPDGRPPEHLLGRRLVRMAFAAYVAVGEAERLDPDRPGSEPRWLGFDDPAPQIAALASTPHAGAELWGSFGSLHLMVAATRAGLGIGTLPCYLADRDPGLQRIERSAIDLHAEVWLLSHPDLRTTARLKALRDRVRAAVVALEPLFGGDEGGA